jgi:hypothetical protein
MRRIFLALGLAAARRGSAGGAARPAGVSLGHLPRGPAQRPLCVKQALPQLKVAKEWKVPVERVFSEVGYLRTVDRIVPGHVPRVLGEDAATKSFVMPFLGPEYRNWKSELLRAAWPRRWPAPVGDVLGRIHAATATMQRSPRASPPTTTFTRSGWSLTWWRRRGVHPALAEGLLATVKRTAATPRVLVHGDVSPKNILLGPDGPVLLDAECAWFGDRPSTWRSASTTSC